VSQTQASKVPRDKCTYKGGSFTLDPETGDLTQNKPKRKPKAKKVKDDATEE